MEKEVKNTKVLVNMKVLKNKYGIFNYNIYKVLKFMTVKKEMICKMNYLLKIIPCRRLIGYTYHLCLKPKYNNISMHLQTVSKGRV